MSSANEDSTSMDALTIRISVIIPVYNGKETLGRCLSALLPGNSAVHEVIVVDDGSTDSSLRIAEEMGAQVVRSPGRRGPAAARNLGAQRAHGDILLFIDCDVVAHEDTVSRVLRTFDSDPSVTAVFGSYDKTPGAKNFLSQYKNLFHHFVHQNSRENASTFWSGCGAIRKETFFAFQGFNELRYAQPSIEDIELGMHLSRFGFKIRLDKDLQVTHLKHWNLSSLLRADVLRRAIPWCRLILRSKQIPDDLNLQTSQRVSAGLAAILPLTIPLILIASGLIAAIAAVIITGLIVSINWNFYRFFIKERGLFFAARVLPFHILYFLYSGFTFVAYWTYNQLAQFRHSSTQLDFSFPQKLTLTTAKTGAAPTTPSTESVRSTVVK